MENIEVAPKNPRWRSLVFVLIGLVLVIISFGAGMYFSGKPGISQKIIEKEYEYVGNLIGKYSQSERQIDGDVNFSLFWETWDELKKTYIGGKELNDKELFYGALKGMVAAVGDPYTIFMEPIVAEEFSDDLAGTFEGIGAEIGMKQDMITIIAPLPEMPAEKAGLMAGDKILAINATSTAGMSVDQAVSQIRGPKDTEVTLTIGRKGKDAAFDVTIKRGKIVVKSIKTEMLDGEILMIKVTNFNNDTEALFSEAVRTAIDKNPKGIILDLRNNPGGYLETAIEMASEWVEDGLIVVEQFADEANKNEHLARDRARISSIPTVVLVNQGSASASEIVAGALQDHKKALLVGERTYGKGSVQTVANFDDGSSLKVTIAKWLTPNGRSINEEGVEPDLIVPLTAEDYQNDRDPQKDAAIELIKNGMKKELINVDTATSTATSSKQ
jgi:carboxyl-terminal processing protease